MEEELSGSMILELRGTIGEKWIKISDLVRYLEINHSEENKVAEIITLLRILKNANNGLYDIK